MKKSTTMLDFFKRKGSTSNSSEVNVELPITNVTIPILENVDVLIPKNADVPISQTQFQRIDLDYLDYSLLILYGCVFEIFFSLISGPPPLGLKSCVRPWCNGYFFSSLELIFLFDDSSSFGYFFV